jgi:DNA-binding CsgD family transcriptional regulator
VGFGLPRTELTAAERADLTRLLEQGERTLGEPALLVDVGERDDEQLLAAMDGLITRLLARGQALAQRPGSAVFDELCDCAIAVQEFRRRIGDHDAPPLGPPSIGDALAGLRAIESTDRLLAEGPAELCDRGGFDRAALMRSTSHGLELIAAHSCGQADWAEELRAFLRHQPVALSHGIVEGEVLRRRRPMLVSDAQGDGRVSRPLAEFLGTRSYVVAPLLHHGRSIGMLHADNRCSDRDVTGADLDRLWAFCEGFGYALERSALLERTRWQQRELRAVLDATDRALTQWTEHEPERGSATAPSSRPVSAMLVQGQAARDLLDGLTARELEVLELIVAGASNAVIAERLFISYGTAKAHVKHILRKLCAANRAEAVSHYYWATRAGR